MTTYTYTKDIETAILVKQAVKASSLVGYLGIVCNGDQMDINFVSPLSAGDEAILDQIVADTSLPPAPDPLVKAKADAKEQIDLAVDAMRRRYITSIAGQDITYSKKERAAREWVDATSPDINTAQFRYLRRENRARDRVGITETPTETALFLLGIAEGWDDLNSIAEEERIFGKMNVDQKANEADVVAAKDAALAIINAL